MIDRSGLADFLRRRREALSPSDVGMPSTSRRRTPGLRREEVAVLAGISSDFYARLEQARGSDPSESVVAALARALRCTPDERDHLFRLAGAPVPPRRAEPRIDPGLLQLVAHLDDVAVCIFTELGDVLSTNALDDALDPARDRGPGAENNLYRLWFTHPQTRAHVPDVDQAAISAAHVSDLRATYSRRAEEPQVTRLINDLLAYSDEFRILWQRHDVAVRHAALKDVHHPTIGLIRLRCQVLTTPQPGPRIRILMPLEGTDAAAKLQLLRVVGNQIFPDAELPDVNASGNDEVRG